MSRQVKKYPRPFAVFSGGEKTPPLNIMARSSLEAGAEFIRLYPGHKMLAIVGEP